MSCELAFGVDVGGSGVKGAAVDLSDGSLVGERIRIPTPQPATPSAVSEVIAEIVRSWPWTGPIGVTIPGVVREGVVFTAANIDDKWIGTDATELIGGVCGVPATALNDADAAGIAEMHYGAGMQASGLVLLLTFGTGIGSAAFLDGKLVPNTELGHLEFKGMVAEHYAAARLVEEEAMELEPWARRVGEYLRHLERVLTPDLFIIGGGISKRFDRFSQYIEVSTPLVPAALRNNAGIAGAALAAADQYPTEEAT